MSMRSSPKAMLSSLVFLALNVGLIWAFPHSDFIKGTTSSLMLPGVIAVYSWAPMHAGWAFISMNVANVIFYYFVFLILWRVPAILRRR